MSEENYDPFWDYATCDEKGYEAVGNKNWAGGASKDGRGGGSQDGPAELAPYIDPNRLLKRCAKGLLIGAFAGVSTVGVLAVLSDRFNVARYVQRYVHRCVHRYVYHYIPRSLLRMSPKLYVF